MRLVNSGLMTGNFLCESPLAIISLIFSNAVEVRWGSVFNFEENNRFSILYLVMDMFEFMHKNIKCFVHV